MVTKKYCLPINFLSINKIVAYKVEMIYKVTPGYSMSRCNSVNTNYLSVKITF